MIKQGIIQRLEDNISNHFGGSTSMMGRGCYFSEDSQKMECEPVKIVSATRIYDISPKLACDQFIEDSNTIDRIANDIQQMFGQEGVFSQTFEIDSVYVGGEKRPQAQKELVDELMF